MTRSETERCPTVEDADPLAESVRNAPGLVLGLDFDGTLAPIVTDPDAAEMDPAVRPHVDALADREDVAVAVVSGRALSDLAERVPVDGVVLAGNHGLEVQQDGDRAVVPAAQEASEVVGRVRRYLDDRLSDVSGCRIEDKGLTLSVHVRETPEEDVPEVRDAVETATAAAEAVRLVHGKAVFEIRPTVDNDKGTAMADRLSAAPGDWLGLYVGDDTTDEDAFRAIQPEGVGVHVGADGETAAAYTLPDQSTVGPFLAWLGDARSTTGR